MQSENNIERKSWLFAAIIMVIFAFVMFFIQHFVVQVFDLAVEISVFYLPAILLVAIYVRRYVKLSR